MPQTLTIAQARIALEDPHACTDAADVLSVFDAVFDGLIRRDGQGGYLPAVAERWAVSDDARTFTFRLREGLRFHNGDPVDGAAVRFSLLRMADPANGGTLGAPGVYAQYLAGMAVDLPEAGTVRVTVARPIADLADMLCYGHILSPRAMAEAGENLAARMVGTGPYRFTGWSPGAWITAEANPFGPPPPYAALRWEAHPTPAARAQALRDGRAEIATDVGAARFDGAEVIEALSPTVMVYLFNAAHGPCADARVRRALNLAIDRAALVAEVLGGAGRPLSGYLSPQHVGYDSAAPALRQDVSEARRLLAEAGHASGLTLAVDCPTRLPDEAQALTAAVGRQLAEVGVTLAVTVHADRVAYANRVREKRIGDMCVFDSSPMSAFRVLQEKIDARFAGSWWQGFHNAEVEALIDRARGTVADAPRTAIYEQIYRLLQDDPPWLYLYNHTRRLAVRGTITPPPRDDGVLSLR